MLHCRWLRDKEMIRTALAEKKLANRSNQIGSEEEEQEPIGSHSPKKMSTTDIKRANIFAQFKKLSALLDQNPLASSMVESMMESIIDEFGSEGASIAKGISKGAKRKKPFNEPGKVFFAVVVAIFEKLVLHPKIHALNSFSKEKEIERRFSIRSSQ